MGLIAGVLLFLLWQSPNWRGGSLDIDPVLHGAGVLLRGEDPYLESWRWVTQEWPWPLAYPMPAVLVAVPFAVLPFDVARAAFMGTSVAVLAFALTRAGWWPLILLLSGPAVQAFASGQWSPLLTGAALVPGLGWLLAAKPNLGLALLLGSPTLGRAWRTATLIVAALAVATVVAPGWWAAYVVAIGPVTHVPMVTRPFGFVLLLAALRWRHPVARILLGLLFIPQSTTFYEALPLGLVAESRREALLFATVSLAAFALWFSRPWPEGYPAHIAFGWPYVLGGVYLPVLAMLLLRRPRPEALAN